ncbi:MAG: sigma 54-interacting transcriptional regulator [Lewinella sp.]|nr:sigma 54-interacting transcriptional regulator [Lewinella sp.]
MVTSDFFRAATLRICGNLDIDVALQSTLLFLQDYIPLDRLYLQYFDQDYGAMRIIATATATDCKKMDLLTPLSKRAQGLASAKALPTGKDVAIYDQPYERLVSREMLRSLDIPCSSLMVMLLESEGRLVGALVFITEKEIYTQQQGDLVALLKEPFVIAMSNERRHREALRLKELLADDNRFLHRELGRMAGETIVGANFGLKEVMRQVRQVASLDSPVLLMGETGVGKDVIANAIHYSSPRAEGPMISVNCGAIPDTLIDSELFGHEKGAFTGATTQKRGRFERANEGSIFLDEISELPLQAQTRLLRVLQHKEIERVGGATTIPLNIRIIAATNRNLPDMVKGRSFREDLWFRLNVFPIWIPPLRERKSDIPALLQHFVHQKSKELKLASLPAISPGAIDVLMDYHWPGNVRELQNIVERALILNPQGPLSFDRIVQPSREKNMPASPRPTTDKLDEVIARHIKQVLSKTGGKIHGPDGAAALLGVNASTLRNRMNKLGIVYGRKVKSQVN